MNIKYNWNDPVHWNEQNVNNVVNRNYTLPKYKKFSTTS